MGATKKIFNEWRKKIILDERETENYPPFDHDGNFKRKVKENWLTTEKLTELTQSSDIMELTKALNYKMCNDDFIILTSFIDHYEPYYIKDSKYISLVCESPLENMERVFQKYTQDDTHNMRKALLIFLESELIKKRNEKN